jgi:hypothetical protein
MHRKIDSVLSIDTVYSSKGLLIYEHADSLYVVSLEDNKVMNKHVVNKGYTWKQLYTITFIALVVGFFFHFFYDKAF